MTYTNEMKADLRRWTHFISTWIR